MNIRTVFLPHRLSDVFWSDDQCHPLIGTLQHILAAQGFYHGAIHSIYDAATREAVVAFQENEKLPATGLLDPITYCRLQQGLSIQIPAKKRETRANATLVRSNILIAKSSRTLTLFNGNSPLRQFPVGIGKPGTPTPVGNFAIASKVMNPGGVLGTRWMGLNYDTYGIHGTNKPWLIGQMVSNGCIRMHNNNAEDLFNLTRIGTPVYIRD